MHARHHLLLALVIGILTAGVFGATAGSGTTGTTSAATVSVDADTVADGGHSFEETAVITLTNGTPGDQLTVGAQPPADTGQMNVTVDGPATRDQSNATHATLTLTDTVDGESLHVTVEHHLNETLAGEAVRFHDRPAVSVVADETGSDLQGEALVRVSIIAQQTIAGFELADPYGQQEPLEIPVDEAGTLTITNVTDEYGNQIYEDESSRSPDAEIRINVTNDNPLIDEKTIDRKIESAETEVELANIDDLELSVDQYRIGAKIRDSETTEGTVYRESRCIVFSNSTTIHYPRGFKSDASGEILIDFGVDDDLINEFEVTLEDKTQRQGKQYLIKSGDIEDNISTGQEEDVKIKAVSPFGSSVTNNGKYTITVEDANPGNYTLTVDVMPELTGAAEPTTESIPLRVHGPIASGAVTVNRTLLGTVEDSAPVSVTVDGLRDDAGVLVAEPNATITNVTIGDTPVMTDQLAVAGPAMTINGVDPTTLPAPTNGTTRHPVTVQLDDTTTISTTDAVSLVHETRALNTNDTWAPVSVPMAVREIEYAEQGETSASEAVTVGWNATTDSYERVDPTTRTGSQAWYVTGADRVGIVYDTTTAPETHTYTEGWHHVGPVMNLSERAHGPLTASFDGLEQATVYDGATPVDATTEARAYETYWINTTAPVAATTPGGYQPANRSSSTP